MDKFDDMQNSEAEILAALPAYALGALEPDELLHIDEYLRAHPELQDRLDELDSVVATIALAAPVAPLPSNLKRQVLARARAEASSRAPTDPFVLVSPADTEAPTSTWIERIRLWWGNSGRLQVALGGASVMAFALIAVVITTQISLRGMDAQLASYSVRVEELETEVTILQDRNAALLSDLEARTQQVATITQPEHTIYLGGTDAMPGARAAFYVRENMGVLVARGLTALQEDQTYQLWLIPAAGNPHPAGLLGQAPDSGATFAVNIDPDAAQFGAVGISIEPAGGSQAPTGPIVLLGEIT